jgi:pSer/pThr/pTyr-binding forkhead associated (FHA) protein
MSERLSESAAWDDLDWGAVPAESLPPVAKEVPPVAQPPAPGVDSTPRPVPGGKQSHVPQSVGELVVRDEAGHETVFKITGDRSIGRRSKNDISIQDLRVSGHHARISLLEDQRFGLEDLGSTGGTFVNDVAIQHHVLNSGDHIRFATVLATFRYIAGPHCGADDDDAGTMIVDRNKAAAKVLAMKRAIPRLVLKLADSSQTIVHLDKEMTLGRNAENDIVVSAPSVSGSHAKLSPTAAGGVELTDLESTCGTHVNGIRVHGKLLADGDEIVFGNVVAVFELRPL